MSVRAFCREQQLGEAGFYAWRKTIRTRDGQVALAHVEPAAAFVPITLTTESTRDPVANFVLELAGGRSLHIPETISVARLADLLCALEARGAS